MNIHTASRSYRRSRASLTIGLALLICASLACNFSMDLGSQPTQAPPTQQQPDWQATQAAGQALAQVEGTQLALAVQATALAQQKQQLDLAATQAAQQAQAAPPTQPAPPTAAAAPATEAPPPEPPTATPEPDIDEMIENANILLFEDIAGYYDLTRWVRDALDAEGYKYTDVGDAVGNFKSEILSGKQWDLVIVAAEARSGFQGELFEYLFDQVNRDTAVIIETWYLDEMALGPISDITSQCGVSFQKDWWEPDNNSRSIVWFDPDHPLFHYPNEGFSLVHNATYWTKGDAGDLMRVRSGGGNGGMVAGLYSWEKSYYGTIAECFDGRVILQTFSTHDYRKSDVTDLWQNYVYYTLKNHFLKLQEGD